jgi:hypothetical protein
MRRFARFALGSFAAFALVPVAAQAQSDDMAYDIRVTDSGTIAGQRIDGVSKGRAIVSRGRVRMELRGNSRLMNIPGLPRAEEATLLMLDSGKMIYLRPKTKQYIVINPAESMDRVQKMMAGMGASMTFDVTTEPRVESLGPGPVILGHRTVHYRVTSGMKMTMAGMGQNQVMETTSIMDQYVAPDLKNVAGPFIGAAWSGASGMFGSGNKSYFEKLHAATAKLPNGAKLLMVTKIDVNGMGQGASTRSVGEVTGMKKVTATPDLFAVPADYTKVELPMGPMGGPGGPPPA